MSSGLQIKFRPDGSIDTEHHARLARQLRSESVRRAPRSEVARYRLRRDPSRGSEQPLPDGRWGEVAGDAWYPTYSRDRPGYLTSAGDIPEDRWLVGDSLGYSGPWGTTYPTNLRHHLGTMDEDTWVEHARTLKTRPPMPWFNLRAFSEDGRIPA